MNTNTQNVSRPNKGVGSFITGAMQCVLGGMLVLGCGLPTFIINLSYHNRDRVVILVIGLVAGGVILTRGLRKCRLYNFSQQVRTIMIGKSRERLLLLSQVTKRNYTDLVRDLRELSAGGVFPGSYVDLNRREFVIVPGGPQPPIVYGNTQLREKQKRSPAPVYAIAIVWIGYALSFPLYRFYDFIVAGVLSLVVCIVVARLSPKQSVIVEEARKVEPAKPPEPINTGNTELDEVLTTAMEYMNELTALDIAITNERIDKPLQEMVYICKQIFDYIKKQPEKVRQIRQFMNYYLPTTIRLLKNYDELSREKVKGDNIKETMAKIEDTMDTILKAFQKELDDLYKDKAMDISVDIEVMQSMMEQEGLVVGSPIQPKAAGDKTQA